ncbi:unnamed protein product [Leptidea sinapis]|uniref:Uncharacterized protein n=1 Tax=Leptidea sinapis TaxID=189913 RepID=A0A5E4QV27_9NEOP|nr:unnamed protein product [Leptidea sinapis]
MLKLKYLIFITTVIAGVHSAPYVNKCKSDDSKCAKEASALLIPMFGDGIPELGIEPVDPLLIKKSDASSPNLKLILTDYTVSGLKNCIPKKVKYDKSKSKILLKLLCTAQLEGTYDMKGQLLILPLEGNGPIHVTLNKAEISIELDLDEIEKDGVKYWNIKDHKFSYVLKDKSIKVFEICNIMYKLKYLVFITTCFAGVYSASFVNKCKSGDSKCVKESAAILIPRFGDGIPELGIEPVDPLFIKMSDASSPNLKLILTDYTLSGLKNKAEISVEADLNEIEKDGVKYWNIKDYKQGYELKDKSVVVFDNLFGGNDVLAPPVTTKCEGKDKKCLKESAQTLLPIFALGIPEYKIHSLDPLSLDKVDADNSNLKFQLTNLKVTGLKDCEGRILILPIEGNGKVEANTKNILIKVDVNVSETQKGTHKYWHIESWNHSFEPKGKSSIKFENLFNGNKALGQAAEDAMKGNGNEIIKEIGPPVIKSITAKVVESVQRFFHAVPLNDLKCLKESAQAILPTFALGMPEYKMHSLDPLMIDKVDADNPNLKFKLTNLKISGLKDCVVKKLEHDADKSKIFLNLLCNVGIEGHYDMKGQIIILPMEGNGKIEADITKAAEDVMKESGNDVIQEVGPPVIKSIASKVVECAQRFFHAVPFNDLVLQ